MQITNKMRLLAAVATSAALLAGCSSDDGDDKAAKGETTKRAQKPETRPVPQARAIAYQPGTPRTKIRRELGTPLPVEDYGLNAQERRDCDYYPIKTQGVKVSYDNVFRFCFKDGKLTSVATAPSRRAAGPGAGAPSPENPERLKPSEKKGKALPGNPNE